MLLKGNYYVCVCVVLQWLSIVVSRRRPAMEESVWTGPHSVLERFTTAKKASHCPERLKDSAGPMADGVDLFLFAAVSYDQF